MGVNPARDIKSLKEIPNAPRLMEQAEVARLLAAMPEHLCGLIACVVFAGFRKEELFYLRWKETNRLDSPYAFRNKEGKPRDIVTKTLNTVAKEAGMEGGYQDVPTTPRLLLTCPHAGHRSAHEA